MNVTTSADTWGLLAAVIVLALAIAAKGARAELERFRVRSRARHALGNAGDTNTAGTPRLLRQGKKPLIAAAAMAAPTAALVLSGVVLAGLILVAEVAAMVTGRRWLHDRSQRRYEHDVPLALDAIARSLRSGSGLLNAVEEAGTAMPGLIGADLRQVARSCSLGGGLGPALQEWAQTRPLASVRLCAAAMSLTLETGGAHAQAVDSVAATVRQQLNAMATATAHAAQARMSAATLTLLPLGVTGLTVLTNVHSRAFMLHSPFGLLVLVVGLGLDGIGAWWMGRLIKRAVA